MESWFVYGGVAMLLYITYQSFQRLHAENRRDLREIKERINALAENISGRDSLAEVKKCSRCAVGAYTSPETMCRSCRTWEYALLMAPKPSVSTKTESVGGPTTSTSVRGYWDID